MSVFGGDDERLGDGEKSFCVVSNWACTSKPIAARDIILQVLW